MRAPRPTLVRALVGAVCVLSIGACGEDDNGPASAAPQRAEAREALAGAPPPLAAVHRQANQLLGGGREAFERRIRELRGHPIVVNKWASWCPPCRAEFPFFQRQAIKHGKRVAFLGVDSNDNDGDAARFLERFPVSYPSYKDPSGEVAGAFNAVQAFPSTGFYDADGKLTYVKQGGYATEAKLAEDIERYARG